MNQSMNVITNWGNCCKPKSRSEKTQSMIMRFDERYPDISKYFDHSLLMDKKNK